LCEVFDYSPWWAYYKAKEHSDGLSKEEIFRLINLNKNQWLRYFQHHWGGWNQRNSNSNNSTPPPPPSPYQYHLQLLQLKFPFTKEELKSAYRRKSLETHPDAGGTAEAFRQVNYAYQVLSNV
ncbi:MAG: J domain-containing protein, partial [Cyanobacteria bacterium P01_H01_bin.150]